MLPLRVTTFLTLLAFSYSQKLIKLSALKGNSEENIVFNGTTAIYATTSSENSDLLELINLDSTDSGNISFYELTQRRKSENGDLMEPWIAEGETILTTSLTKDQLKTLSGYIYCTSEKQSADPLFHVYGITKNQTVKIDSGESENITAVFLNANRVANDSKDISKTCQPTAISEWKQDSETSVKMYPNIPSDKPEIDSSQVFSNPMSTSGKSTFFQNVNDFTVTVGLFHMKISGKGSVQFNTSPTYYDINSTKTNSVTSTGFYMKSSSEADRSVVINLLSDPNYSGTSGANSIAKIPQNGKVEVSTYSTSFGRGGGMTFPPSNQIVGYTTDSIGDNITISSKDTNGGQFFIQYFTIQGEQVTTPTTQ